jgi:P27 family predicted phage terminase small subunit
VPRRPRPTPLKVIEGNPGKRSLNRREPVPDPTLPACPEWLSPEGAQVWERLAPQLHARKVLSDWDAECFAVFCDAVVQHRRARELIGAALLVKGRRDGLVTNPAWRIYRDSAALIRSFAQEFGLTPSARSGIELPEVRDLDPAIFLPVRVRGR